MKKLFSTKTFLTLATVFFLAGVFVPVLAFAEPQTGGLIGMYTKLSYRYNSVTVLDKDMEKVVVAPKECIFMDSKVENVNFWNFDTVLNERIGRTPYTAVRWRGALKIEEKGAYDFRFTTNYAETSFRISDSSASKSGGTLKELKNVQLDTGWHRLEIYYGHTREAYDAKAVFEMKKSSQSKYEEIPTERLSPAYWSDEEIELPFEGPAKFDYVVAGAGAVGKTKVEVAIDWSEIKGAPFDALLVWYNPNDPVENHKVTITNENTGASDDIDGVNLVSAAGTGVEYPEAYGRIPKALIDDGGTGKLRLSFKKPTGLEFKNGLSLLVPFEDLAKEEAIMKMQMVAATGYQGMSPALVFELDESRDNKISPVFMLANGETKSNYLDTDPSDETYYKVNRPNYLMMAYGKDSKPGKTSVVQYLSNHQRIVPSKNDLDLGDSDSFYPAFGREGRQFDVISAKYLPNQASGVFNQYVNQQEGKIDEITIPKGNNWVAFQYYGSNYVGSGVIGGGESASITGGGLVVMPSAGPTNFELKVSVTGSGKVASADGKINCPGDCVESYPAGETVKLTATADYHNEFSGWSGSGTACDGTNSPTCNLTINAETTIKASFSYVPGGVCGSANGGSSCTEPQIKCYLGIVVNENYDSSTSTWTWQCEKDGYLSGVCSTVKKCQIKEVSP